MVMDLLDQHQRQSQPPADPTDLAGRMGSTTSSKTTAQATLKALEIGYFFPNMPLDWGDKDIVEKEGKLYY